VPELADVQMRPPRRRPDDERRQVGAKLLLQRLLRRRGGLRGRLEPRFRHATILAVVPPELALREGTIGITDARVHPGKYRFPAFVVDDPYEELAGL
jgi:hypothetical protein